MGSAKRFRSAPECYASALAIEHEAARRYREFAELLEDHGDRRTAALLRELAHFQEERVAALLTRSKGLALPQLEAWRYSWIDDAPPDKVAHEVVYHLMTPHDALAIALGAERRAAAFFRQVGADAEDAGLARLAAEIVEEDEHQIARIEEAIARVPRPFRYGEDYEAFVMR